MKLIDRDGSGLIELMLFAGVRVSEIFRRTSANESSVGLQCNCSYFNEHPNAKVQMVLLGFLKCQQRKLSTLAAREQTVFTFLS